MNKTFTMTALGCMFATAAFAAPTQIQNSHATLPQAGKSLQSEVMVNGRQLSVPGDNATLRKAPMKESLPITDIIYEAEGTEKLYSKDCGGYYLYYGFILTDYVSSGLASTIVYGDNGDVYFLNILSNGATDTYVKGHLEGNKITMNLPQTVLWDDEAENGYNLAALKLTTIPAENEGEEDQYTYVVDEEITSVTFTVAEDGTITLDEFYEDGLLGYALVNGGGWSGYGDLYQSYTPATTDFNTLPEGVKTEPYAFITGDSGYFVNIGFDDEYMYIVGLSTDMPDGVVKAKLNGNTASIEQNQCLGILMNTFFVYTKCLLDDEVETLVLADPEMTYDLNIDFEGKSITAVNPDIYFCLNAAKDRIYYVGIYQNMNFFVQESMAGTPRTPYDIDFIDNGGITYFFQFYLSSLSTEGNLLDFDNLYYRIFIDGEVYGFESNPEDYEYLCIPEGEVWSEIPCSFYDYDDFYFYGSMYLITLYFEGYETVGVQLVYKNEGVVTYSDIASFNVETGEIEVGVKGAQAEKALSTTYFDLNGRRVNAPANGIFVKKQTLEDGSIRTSKVIVK